MAVRDGTARIHTSCPAIVTAYDPDRQTVSARIVIRGRYKDGEGEVKSEQGATLVNVPVMFPHSGSGFGMTFPLSPGDWVILHVAERSIVEWKSTGNDDIEAGDLRRFSYSDCYAYPGTQPPVDPIDSTGVDPSAMVIEGQEIKLGSSFASDPVAMSGPTDSNFNAILNLLQTWVPVASDGGAALQLAAQALSNQLTGSSKVKAE